MEQPLIARILGWPSTVYRREDTGTTSNEAKAARDAVDSYAVASGNNLQLGNTNPVRIALFVEPTPFTHISGYSTRFKNLVRQLKACGDEILVIVPENDPDAPSDFEGVRIVNVPGFRFPLYKEVTLTFGFRGVYQAIKDFNPDVIHSTTPGLSGYTTLVIAKILKIPLLLSYHTHLPKYVENYGLGIFSGATWSYLRLLHNCADFSLTTSPQLCEEIIQNGFQRIGLWRKGIDTEVFNPSKRSAEMRSLLTNGHPEDPLIINVGRLGSEKNLKSFKELLKRLPNVRLALVGDGPIREELEHLLEGTNSYFAGTLKGEELSAAFASADVFVMPSVTETMGFVALESMASGVPVVGARAGGIPDMVQHEATGYLFEPNSIDECETHVRRLLDNPQKRQEMANAARQESLNWAWTASAAATRNVGYGRAISNYYLSNSEETVPIRLASFLGNNFRRNTGNENA